MAVRDGRLSFTSVHPAARAAVAASAAMIGLLRGIRVLVRFVSGFSGSPAPGKGEIWDRPRIEKKPRTGIVRGLSLGRKRPIERAAEAAKQR
ncbi:hypothetical protein GCM10022293_45820 [Azospirillum formosense]